jgi:hypothetical protein
MESGVLNWIKDVIEIVMVPCFTLCPGFSF